jgi:hypothetical protein
LFPSLPELRWAFDRGIIGAGTVVEAAQAIVNTGGDLIAIQSCTPSGEAPPVSEPSHVESPGDDDEQHTRRKWVWPLSWIYVDIALDVSIRPNRSMQIWATRRDGSLRP